MIDNYQAQIKSDGTFQCFHCRKYWDWKTRCSLDFPAIPGRERFLICNDDFKKSGGLAGNTKVQSNQNDTFFCFITHKTYDTKQELSLELEANDWHERLLISNEAVTEAIVESCKNRGVF